MRGRELFRAVRWYIVAAAVTATAAALVFAIYFTQAGLPWISFLTGILVAAVFAEAVRVSRSEWVVMRRTAQVSSLKDKLEHETTLRKKAEEKLTADKARLQLIDETLLTMVALIDTEGHCRYHNRAFRDWLHMRPELIDGRHIREIFGAKAYADIATAVRQSLDGQPAHYEHTQQMPNGAVYRLSVEQIPQFDEAGKVSGFYFLADDITARGDLHPTEKPEPGRDSTENKISTALARNELSFQELRIDSQRIPGQKEAGKRIMAAIQKGDFRLYCQLISPLSINSGKAEHYEILIRLMEEEEGMLPPGAFFPLAERHGLMPFLDRWVVQHVLEWVSSINQQQLRRKDSIFFINVAAATIGDPDFPDFLQTTLLEYGIPGSILCFEVPESELAIRGASTVEFIQRVRRCGCRVALSGFGRDAVTFDRIRGFQVEFLKIDGSIILNMLREPADLAKVVSIEQVAKKIGVKTVAELVESEELISKLRSIGVDFAQGFGISRPRSLSE
jgi:PAS domain S-box-containing protein